MMDKLRPRFHYTPRKGYMNDPNGLVFDRTSHTYHLFYQYSDTIKTDEWFGSWEEKNWGHATSADLIHWTEQPVAFEMDDLGLIWSGSSVIDRNNSSGLFPADSSPDSRIACFYANASRHEKTHGEYGIIRCCMGYTPDNGKSWRKVREPVIKNEGDRYDRAFGDPKVFWYEKEKLWIMITALRIRIFSSPDLINWKLESEPTVNGEPFCAECPDIFEYDTDFGGKWVFSGAGKYYIIGDFRRDEGGKLSFIPETPKLTLEAGNLYASQHFYGIDRIVQMSWMADHSSLDYRKEGKKWDGVQSIPTELRISKTNTDWQIARYPIPELNELRGKVLFECGGIETGCGDDILENVFSECFDLEGVFDVSECSGFELRLRKKGDEETLIGFDGGKKELIINTYNSGRITHQYIHIPNAAPGGLLKMRIMYDISVFDIFIDGGRESRSLLLYPDEGSSGMSLRAKGRLLIKDLRIYEMV